MWSFNNNGRRDGRFQRRRPIQQQSRTVQIPVRRNGRPHHPSPPSQQETQKKRRPEPEVEAEAAESAAPTDEKTGNSWQEKYLRLAAEKENDKKRIERRFAGQFEQEKAALLRDFLPVVDNLERTLTHTAGDGTADSLRQGVELTYKSFLDTLAQRGVKPIAATGRPFDPNLHEAVGVVPHPTLPANTVMQVEETGYLLGDRLLRPAKVLVTE